MSNRIDTAAAARALIEPLNGYTPGPWRKHGNGKQIVAADTIIAPRVWGAVKANTRLIAAAPALRDMVATLADALEAERAKVAAAYEAAAREQERVYRRGVFGEKHPDHIRALTPDDAQDALDKMLAEARLEGWRAGLDAAAHACDWGNIYGDNAVQAIQALPEPKETSDDPAL